MSTIPPPLDTYPLSEGPEIVYVGRYDVPDAMYNRYKNDCAAMRVAPPNNVVPTDDNGLPVLPAMRGPLCHQRLTKDFLLGNEPQLAMVEANVRATDTPVLSKKVLDGFEQTNPPYQSIQALKEHAHDLDRSSWDKLVYNHLLSCEMDKINAEQCASKLYQHMFGSKPSAY